jgi:hypothetical protein
MLDGARTRASLRAHRMRRMSRLAVAPCSLVQPGSRWHLRARCYRHDGYRFQSRPDLERTSPRMEGLAWHRRRPAVEQRARDHPHSSPVAVARSAGLGSGPGFRIHPCSVCLLSHTRLRRGPRCRAGSAPIPSGGQKARRTGRCARRAPGRLGRLRTGQSPVRPTVRRPAQAGLSGFSFSRR